MPISKSEELFLIPPNDNRKTFDEDENLPSLPLPDIGHTLNRYLDSLKPFVTSGEYDRSVQLVKRFQNGIGLKLHEKLRRKAERERNWVEKWWEDVAYLRGRLPLVYGNMNSVLPKNVCTWTYGTEVDQIKHASYFGYNLTRFWDIIRNEKLLPAQTADKKTNFSMSQYRRLFNTTRVPGDETDSLVSYFKTVSEGSCPSSVVIMCKGRMFHINIVTDEKSVLMSLEEWEDVLGRILSVCHESEETCPLGVLTCDSRSNWSKNRKHLEQLSRRNAEMLNLIERSVFVLSLDDDSPETDAEVANCNVCGNHSNRWIDKSICSIVYKNGRSGSMSDHTAFDGIVALSCLNFVMAAAEESKTGSSRNVIKNVKSPEFSELKFDLDDFLRREIGSVQQIASTYRNDIFMTRYIFDDYGKLEIQRLRYHPDSYAQMCLQLAYVALHGKPASCYETATTRKFYNGRTETVRSCTTECLDWVASMLDAKRSNEEKKTLLDRAVGRHDELMREARENRGCDRHLFGLYCMALEEGIEIPDLYLDPSYFKSGGGGNFILSTSCIGYSPLGGGVPPMCKDGYGVFYNILPTSIHFTISVNNRSQETSAKGYFESIRNAFRQMRDVLIMASKSHSKL